MINMQQTDSPGRANYPSADANDSRYVLIALSGVPEDACNNLRNRMRSIAHHQSSSAECATGDYYISL